MLSIDEDTLRTWLQDDQWYRRVYPAFVEIEKAERQDKRTANLPSKDSFYALIERELEAGAVALGETGKNWDSDRQMVDTIVIHHSANPPGMTLRRLNAMHLLRLYGRYYSGFAPQDRGDVQGQAIYSGHFNNGRQVFFGYHWFVRTDGNAERLLPDHQIGWHAGPWAVNRRSIGICIDDDLEVASPTEDCLRTVGAIIRSYPNIKKAQVVGHREVREGTTCPGGKFISTWKPRLLEILG